jgi:hypothetical protein
LNECLWGEACPGAAPAAAAHSGFVVQRRTSRRGT